MSRIAPRYLVSLGLSVGICLALGSASQAGEGGLYGRSSSGEQTANQQQIQQLEQKIGQFEQFLQQLRQERMSRPRDPEGGEFLNSFDELGEIGEQTWNGLDGMCQEGAFEDDPSIVGGEGFGGAGLSGGGFGGEGAF